MYDNGVLFLLRLNHLMWASKSRCVRRREYVAKIQETFNNRMQRVDIKYKPFNFLVTKICYLLNYVVKNLKTKEKPLAMCFNIVNLNFRMSSYPQNSSF